jgi:acyl carrier protein
MTRETMTREQVKEELFSLLRGNFNVDETVVREETPMTALGLDSLDLIDLIVFIHQRFAFRRDVHEYRAAKTLGEVVDFVFGIVGAREGAA